VRTPNSLRYRLGWERGFAVEMEVRRSQENAKKRDAYPPLAARCVGRELVLTIV
jgi:hypothetical protein